MAEIPSDALTKEIKLFGFLITTSNPVSRQEEAIENETRLRTPSPTNSEETTSADCTDLPHFFLEQESGKQPLYQAMGKKKGSRKGASSSRPKNPKMPDELADPQILNPNPKPSQNPISIDEDTQPSETQNPISIDEDTQPSETQNPISIDGVENVKLEQNEPFIGNPNLSQEETEDVEVIPNPDQKPDSVDVENELSEPQIADSAEEKPELGNQNPIFIESESQVEQQAEKEKGEKEEDHEEPEGMLISPVSLSAVEDIDMYDLSETPMPTPNASRKTAHKKKKPNPKKVAAFEKRLQIVKECLKPIPFVPDKSLNFAKHEELLKKLGLWDFVHIEFDREIRTDLVAMFIAGYNHKQRYTAFNDARVSVSRADIARALKLPAKKDKSILVETSDSDSEKLSDEEVLFMMELLDNWVLLHEDTWMMPKEVVNWTDFIKSGQPQKVDWATVMWFMVDKELAQAPQLGWCYYASHLQLVMKFQKEWLFVEEPRQEVSEDVREETVDVKESDKEHGELFMRQEHQKDLFLGQESKEHHVDFSLGKESEEQHVDLSLGQKSEEQRADLGLEQESEKQQSEEHHVDLSLGKESEEQHVDLGLEQEPEKRFEEHHVDSIFGQESEEQHVDLSLGPECEEQHVDLDLGQEKNESVQQLQDDMDLEDYKEEPGNSSHWGLRRCDMNNVHDLESKDPMEEVNVQGRFEFPAKCNLDSLASVDPFQGMDNMDAPYSPSIQLSHHTTEGLFSRVDTHINRPGPSFLGNGCKREISHDDGTDDANFNDHHKRMRLDGQWDSKPQDFEFCMDQINSWMSKARVMYAAKEQECLNARLNQELVVSDLHQQSNSLMLNFHNATLELQKRENDNYKLEHELHNMTALIEDYKKALKQARRAFSEYRERNPEPEEPLYKDAGPGGLVLSTMELEKQRLAQEEEKRLQCCMIEQMIMEFQVGWLNKLEEHQINVNLLSERLFGFQKEVELLKEQLAKPKMSET